MQLLQRQDMTRYRNPTELRKVQRYLVALWTFAMGLVNCITSSCLDVDITKEGQSWDLCESVEATAKDLEGKATGNLSVRVNGMRRR